MRMLIQTQLSNYDTNGNFILEADSGWQMVMGRVREMLRLVPDIEIHILGPLLNQLKTDPREINPDLFKDPHRVKYYGIHIMPNALATRFDFNMGHIAQALGLHLKFNPGYDWVYINDPMHLRNFKAMFNLYRKEQPKFAVHSHFIDNPSCPKFPVEASLWLGQVEASIRADINFWQCQSALDIFKEEAKRTLRSEVVDYVMFKSHPWDDGYSTEEVNQKLDESKIRFSPEYFFKKTQGKKVIFVPNRVGGRGRSSDYTNCGKFLFEFLPQLAKIRNDYVVIAGNPSQKFSNKELEDELAPYGFVNLVPDSLRREEYLWVGKHSDISVGLYDQDSYGGTAARELVDLGTLPLWLDVYEYASIARAAGYEKWLVKPDFSDLILRLDMLLQISRYKGTNDAEWFKGRLRDIVHDRCSYDATTKFALEKMGVLPQNTTSHFTK